MRSVAKDTGALRRMAGMLQSSAGGAVWLSGGAGMRVSRIGLGAVRVTFDLAFSGLASYIAITNPYYGSGTAISTVISEDGSGFTIATYICTTAAAVDSNISVEVLY